MDRALQRLNEQLTAIRAGFAEVFLILSPPRCSSTALARVFWEHPTVRSYLHEPFEQTFFLDGSVEHAVRALQAPLELRDNGRHLVIKEMTFQVGEHFPSLASLTTRPLVFMTRDPRLSIWSRLRKRHQDDYTAIYPEVESGWSDLVQQVEHCRRQGLRYVLVDSTEWRNSPREILASMFERLGLEFSPALLSWRERSLPIANFGDDQDHWYRRVMASRGIQPASETAHEIREFPPAFQGHVRKCLGLYRDLLEDENLICTGGAREGG